MNKQEQIEEMAKDIVRIAGLDVYGKAEELINLGYRKFPEDSVVLSREEYKRLLDNAIRVDMEYLDHELAKTRKETAKEIFYQVVNICRKEIDFQDGTINTQLEPLYFGIINGCDFVMDEVKRLAKQYSVEVEE